MSSEYAVIFLAWGDRYIKEVENCIKNSSPIHQHDIILITDPTTAINESDNLFSKVIRTEFKNDGLLRKTELIHHIPEGYQAYLFLDSDITVLENIDLGFEKAEQFSIAMVPSPFYSLNDFWDFSEIMKKEKIPNKGQLQYNSGVIFFTLNRDVLEVFKKWYELGRKHKYHNDQPLLSMAMEQLGLNPYTLSPSFNYRGRGELISGKVFLWHSHYPYPKNINEFDSVLPPRRVIRGRLEEFAESASVKKILVTRLKLFFKKMTSFTRR
ncbi:MAG: putative nucleotide-diphospho-sugar transferase [Balneolaceae bacterium]|nr:putative nucleotide-diphospho-sugar transferase [Balneolaceae bacterium]